MIKSTHARETGPRGPSHPRCVHTATLDPFGWNHLRGLECDHLQASPTFIWQDTGYTGRVSRSQWEEGWDWNPGSLALGSNALDL